MTLGTLGVAVVHGGKMSADQSGLGRWRLGVLDVVGILLPKLRKWRALPDPDLQSSEVRPFAHAF